MIEKLNDIQSLVEAYKTGGSEAEVTPTANTNFRATGESSIGNPFQAKRGSSLAPANTSGGIPKPVKKVQGTNLENRDDGRKPRLANDYNRKQTP
jgi:hypothetical protein